MLPVWVSVEIFGVHVRIGGYGVCVFLGIVAALLVAFRRARPAGLTSRALASVFLCALLAGFAGARLTYPLQMGGSPFRGGLVLYGGLLWGVAAAWIACRLRRLPALRVADLAAPCVLLGVALGRMGCFFAGCCYGAIADAGLRYPPGSHAFRDHLRHGWIDASATASLPTVPAPLLEAAALLAIFAILSVVARRNRIPGRVLALAGILYPAWRFIAEFGRGDHVPYWGPVLTFSQGISLGVLGASALFLLRLRPVSGRPPLPSSPLSRVQIAGFAAILVVFGAGLACRVASSRPQEMAGELVLAGGCDRERRVKIYREAKEEAQEAAGDCVGDCMSSCMEDCISDCLGCECDEEEEAEQPAPTPAPVKTEARKRAFVRRPPAFRELLQAGSSLRALLGIEGTLNGRFPVALLLKGTVDVVEVPKRGPVVLLARLEEISITAGERSVSGKGELEIRIAEDLEFVVTRASLPDDVLSLLHSAAPLLGGYLRVEVPGTPDPAIRAAIERELAVSGPGTQAKGTLLLDRDGRRVDASAELVRVESGDWRLKWKTYR